MAGAVYLVATPIGNLGDLTVRARDVLSSVSFVACEDTRRSRVLLDHYGIHKEVVSLPAFAEGQRAGRILDRVGSGEDCAVITDAGSPGISDPGEKLVGETLAELAQVLGDRRACVARELTKVHEEFVRGTLSELARAYQGAEVLGEIVLVVEGRAGGQRWTVEEVRRALEDGLGRGEKL